MTFEVFWYVNFWLRQKSTIWDAMSTEEREQYLAENSHKGNKRYAFLSSMTVWCTTNTLFRLDFRFIY